MKLPASVIRHRRVGPAVDVALCGERGNLCFVQQRKHVSCLACRAKHEALSTAGHQRVREQLVASKAQQRRELKDFRRSP